MAFKVRDALLQLHAVQAPLVVKAVQRIQPAEQHEIEGGACGRGGWLRGGQGPVGSDERHRHSSAALAAMPTNNPCATAGGSGQPGQASQGRTNDGQRPRQQDLCEEDGKQGCPVQLLGNEGDCVWVVHLWWRCMQRNSRVRQAEEDTQEG